MGNTIADNNIKPKPDKELIDIAEYVVNGVFESKEAYDTARYCLMDTLGCGFLALQYPACTRHLGPIVPDTLVPHGVRVPGTHYHLDPIKAAFDIGCMVRWLDFNDTWLAAEWGHPSDNLGAILAVADYVSQQNCARGDAALTMKDVLTAMIKAHEIQGILALENSFNRIGLDHVVLVKVASTALATHLLGGDKHAIVNALSQAWVDGQSLRTYRHAPNAGPRKSWAAGDATSRAVRLAMITMKGEEGYPSVLSAKTWGFNDVFLKGQPLKGVGPFGSYVMENVLFKISFPAEFHAQTAVEAAVKLYPRIKDRLDQIERIEITTHESAVRIISKEGPLHNPADRDHCLQYMVAIGLLFGDLTAEHYEDAVATDPMIDTLRSKMYVQENTEYSKDYLDPGKRSIANALQVIFKDGSSTDRVEVEYPIGHRRRREEGVPVLIKKFERNLLTRFPQDRASRILELCLNTEALHETAVTDFMSLISL